MIRAVKAVDVVAAVGCKHLLTPGAELDAGNKRCPAMQPTLAWQFMVKLLRDTKLQKALI